MNNSCPVPLTPQQNEQLMLLWKSHSRELIDVPLSCEGQAIAIPNHAATFIMRLHDFFAKFLEHALLDDSDKEDDSDDNERVVDMTNGRREQFHFIQAPHQSSLHVFANFAVTTKITLNRRTKEIRLAQAAGRRVMCIRHEDFLLELNQYEVQDVAPSTDFVRRESFGAFLYHMPELALQSIGCALALAMVTIATKHSTSSTSPGTSVVQRFVGSTKIVVRFAHLNPEIQMIDIKTGLVGKLLSIKGHVVKARAKRLCVATADFVCLKCGSHQTHRFCDGRYSMPTQCINMEKKCRSKTFSMMRSTARYIDAQEIRLQEAPDENTVQAGRTPRQMEVELTHDLVDQCRPGDIILVAATVAAINTAVAAGQTGKRAKETSTYKLYLRCHSLTTLSETNANHTNHQRQRRREHNDGHTTQVTYTHQQLCSITQLCHADHRYFGLQERRAFPFDLLVRSICPAIIGHNEVKAGLLLCLLGGTLASGGHSEKGNTIRSNSHVLIVGDPGMGKSQMLLAATQLAARSVYVGGNTSSTTGLTVTLTKEAGGETGLEAGALVLADCGVCAIDEFDKMAKNHQDGLLEAMEQQQVSIAKAGVVASLPARCSVIAAANPRDGSYNMSKTVAENLNIAKPILSRFDLVFILRDRANTRLDKMVSSNIMNLYRNQGNHLPVGKTAELLDVANQPALEASGDRISFSARLAWVSDFQKDPLPADLVRDYIAYAREYCKPKLTPEAAAVLKDFFMELRYPSDGRRKADTVPITTRQLEALIRLCQARAKACLRDFVLKEDALDVVELMSSSVEQVHSDEHGVVDVSRGGAGGKSNRKMKKAFVDELQRIVGIEAGCTLDDLRRIAEKVNCGLNEFAGLVEDLRNSGVLLKQSNGRFRVLS